MALARRRARRSRCSTSAPAPGGSPLDLARAATRWSALDRDPELLAELTRRAGGLNVAAVAADARTFDLERRFALCIVPMQTIQLLGGGEGRRAFLARARDHLQPDGVLAIAIAPMLELFEVVDGDLSPLPDIRELDGVVYSSLPTAVRAERDGFVLERRRERITAAGARSVEHDVIRLDRVTAAELESEAARRSASAEPGASPSPRPPTTSAARW